MYACICVYALVYMSVYVHGFGCRCCGVSHIVPQSQSPGKYRIPLFCICHHRYRYLLYRIPRTSAFQVSGMMERTLANVKGKIIYCLKVKMANPAKRNNA